MRRRLRLLPRASDGGLSKPPSVAPDLGTDKHVYLLPEEYRQPPVPQSAEDREAMLRVELKHLQGDIKRLEGIIAFKNGVLLWVAGYFEGVLTDNNPQSVEGMKRMVSRIKGAVDRQQGGLPE